MRDPPPGLSAALKALPRYNPREDMKRTLQSLIDAASGSEPEEVEKRMLGAVLGEHNAAAAESTTGGSQAPRAPPDSSSLVASLSSRLAKAEILGRALRNQLFKRSRQLSDARRQNAVLMQALDEMQASGDVLTGLCELEQENVSLRSQLHEMETFLADYGLIWVGGQGTGRQGQAESPGLPAAAETAGAAVEPDEGGGHTSSSSAAAPSVDLPRLLRGIKELNRLMQMEGELSTVASRGGARAAGFQALGSLPITIFRNGILIRRGPFRPFEAEATRAFVSDILDGFFPYELKAQHPDGVLFDLLDKSDEDHRPFVPFTGPGSAVGCSKVRTVQSLKDQRDQQQVLPLATSEFLTGLPDKVVKAGRIVDVRGGLHKALLLPDADNAMLLETPTLKLIRDRSRRGGAAKEAEEGEEGGGGEGVPADVATLRVLSADGSRSYVMKMRFDSTCFELYKLCDELVVGVGGEGGRYELRTRYPSRALPRCPGADTLQDLGLIPNATLMIRQLPPATP